MSASGHKQSFRLRTQNLMIEPDETITLGVLLFFPMDGNAHTGWDLDTDVIQDTTHRPDDIRVNVVFVIEQECRNPPFVEIRLPALITCHNLAPAHLNRVE